MATLTQTIVLHVAPEAAQAFNAASPQERRKLEVLVNLRLLEALREGSSLQRTMREIGEKAQARGLTPEILDTLLHDS